MDPSSFSRTSGNGKLSKGAIVLIVAVIVIALAIIILVTLRATNRRREQEELEAQLQSLQMQANDPNTTPGERQGLWTQMSTIASRIQAMRNKYGSGGESSTEVDVFWSGNGSGICASSGVLNKDRTLKKGVNSMEVCQLQALLNKKGAKLPVDGKFSNNTEAALKALASNRTSITLRQIPKSYWA